MPLLFWVRRCLVYNAQYSTVMNAGSYLGTPGSTLGSIRCRRRLSRQSWGIIEPHQWVDTGGTSGPSLCGKNAVHPSSTVFCMVLSVQRNLVEAQHCFMGETVVMDILYSTLVVAEAEGSLRLTTNFWS